MVCLSRKHGHNKRYDCYLPKDAINLFSRLTKGKDGKQRIFLSADGQPWTISNQLRSFQKLLHTAEAPAQATPYSLRHYYISKALLADVHIKVLADNCDTSVRMIEKHYAKFLERDRCTILNRVRVGGGDSSVSLRTS